MKTFLQDLEALDSKENHLKTFDDLLLVYLSSEEADSNTHRLNVLALALLLRRLFM